MSNPKTTGSGYAGQSGLGTFRTSYNALHFIVRQFLGEVRTCTLVKVLECTNSGDVSEVGSVDVQPLVNLIDGLGYSAPHATVFNLPYFRVQGGSNAIIIDPSPGDIGLAVFADRDISSVKVTKEQANPASRRRFSISDGIYIGGILNGTPTQYWQFNSDGMAALDKNGNTITMDGSGVTINGVLIDRSGNISGAGTVQASGEGTFGGHTVGEHIHGGVTPGSGSTEPPTG